MRVARVHEPREGPRGDLGNRGVGAELVLEAAERERVDAVARGGEIALDEERGNRRNGRRLAGARLNADGGRLQHDDRSSDRALPPLRWVAEENLVYDPATRTLHRRGCPLARELQATAQALAAGAALELVWAPRMCECRPDVTLALG